MLRKHKVDYGREVEAASMSSMLPKNWLYAFDRWRSNDFFLKSGYVARPNPEYFADELEGPTWQPDVYPFAAEFAVRIGSKKIIDIGCGRALKLAKLHAQHPDWEFIGIDYGANVSWCRENQRFGKWIEADLEYGKTLQTDNFSVENSILICSDIIEHLVNPVPFLRLIRKLLRHGATAVVFSTPERDLTRGESDYGPPYNPCHVREWTAEEFRALLEWAGFKLVHFGLTRSNDAGPDKKTILAIAALPRTADRKGVTFSALRAADSQPFV
jgi:2-polyprenyl-3-methyl-5-hydroxy-6-metoxy-1,4-benzoquinol methylase